MAVSKLNFVFCNTCGINPTPGPGIQAFLVPGIDPKTLIQPKIGFKRPTMHLKSISSSIPVLKKKITQVFTF